MIEELKPCLFCGGEAEITKWHEGYFVKCRKQRCGGTIGAYKTEEEAIEAWNTLLKEATMISNDERREVAARLRKVKSECDERDYPWMAEDLMQALGFSTYEEGEDGIFDRLAELIEPEPERTCHKELMITEDYRGTEVEYFGCSECGQWLSDTDCYGLGDGPNYCENCGCKVDSSFVTDECTGEVIYRDGEKVVK